MADTVYIEEKSLIAYGVLARSNLKTRVIGAVGLAIGGVALLYDGRGLAALPLLGSAVFFVYKAYKSWRALKICQEHLRPRGIDV